MSRPTLRPRWWAAAMAGAMVWAVTPVAPGSAQVPNPVVTTTTFADVADPTDGLTSLREAVLLANTRRGDDVIVLAAGRYELTLCDPQEEDDNDSGDLDHDDDARLTILGNGATIAQTCADERILHGVGDGPVVLDALVLTGGAVRGSGGAILATGSLTVFESTITGNSARPTGSSGGGGGIHAAADLTLLDVRVADNMVDGTDGSHGGGGIRADGAVLMVRSRVTGNDSGAGSGGGIQAAARLEIRIGEVTANRAGAGGGGIHSMSPDAVVTLADLEVGANTAGGPGGGILTTGSIILQRSAVIDNDTASNGGGLALQQASAATGTIVENTLIDANRATGGGGGIRIANGRAALRHTTVTDNRAGAGAAVDVATGAAPVQMEASVIAGGTAGSVLCRSGAGAAVESSGHSLVTDGSCGATTATDITATDPRLRSRTTALGERPQRVPERDSELVDAVPPSSGGCTTLVDQRLVERPVGSACDIGAVEVCTTVAAPVGPAGFADVAAGAYYAIAVDVLAANGITTGVAPGRFAPDDAVDRRQMATFLRRLACGYDGGPDPGFADVPAGEWYSGSIAWLAAARVTTGTGVDAFSPVDVVTRGQMATFLHRMAGSPAAAGSRFTDVGPDRYYSTAVGWLDETGITTGFGDETFRPDDPVTRAQMAAFLARYLDHVDHRL